MRLLHSTTLKLVEFREKEIPLYAILSHTWEEGEVSFQDMQGCNADQKAGYNKIQRCCKAAAADGFEYAWVDTCCIDKTSSSELSEAINSMYRWYQKAEVCYVYLSDVPSDGDPLALGSDYSKSRWFTRGWTLQELIAPSNVIFFGSDWKEIGTKSSLQAAIVEVTAIQVEALLSDDDHLQAFSVAQRMTWAAKRETTRIEDLAYCLLGLFDVSMPMLYGEGERAFIRLQEEIIKRSDDTTIFAWRSDIIWDFKSGLLATSPSRFLSSGNIVQSKDRTSTSFTITNKGLHIKLQSVCLDDQTGAFLGVLNCHDASNIEYELGIFLQMDETGEDCYRTRSDVLGMMNKSEAIALESKAIYIKQWPRLIFDKYTRRYNQYRIRATEIQGHYPPGFVQLDGTIDLEAGARESAVGAVEVAVYGNSAAVVLKIADGVLSANIVTSNLGESLEEIVKSFDAETPMIRRRIWREEPDRIVWQMPQGGYLFVGIRKQLVSGNRTITVDITI